MGTPVELIASYWTISGVVPNGLRGYSRFDFQERVEAAARAGFKGLGIWHEDLEHILEHKTLSDMRRILDDNGMKHVELEFLTDWFLEGERRIISDLRKKKLLTAAEVLRARHVKVGDLDGTRCEFDRLVESFAALCADAARHGTSIVYEPMDVAVLDKLQDSLRMVTAAGAANGGIILDIWHAVDREMPDAEISRMPSRYLMGVELDDAVMDGSSIRKDEGKPRKFCGEGDLDVKGFIKRIQDKGYNGPWGVEVFSEAQASMALHQVADRAYTTTMAQFGKGA